MLLGATASAFTATASEASPPPLERSLVVRRHVRRPGVYHVTITVSARGGRPLKLELRVGSVTRHAVALADRAARISLTVKVRGRELMVRALGAVSLAHIAISVHYLRASVGARTPAPKGTTGATTPTPPSAAGRPIGDPGKWHSIFDDEFSGSSLDTSKWRIGWFGSGITGPLTPAELQCFDPSQVSVSGGELDVAMISHTESCSGQTRPYTSGIVTTDGKFQFTYGFFEVRAWVPGSGGVIPDWPDIWTDGQHWPTDGEDDVMEGLSGRACWHFHYQPGTAGPGSCSHQSFTGGWHTFGADWEPGVITYYYDGHQVGTIAQGITSAPMYVIISLAADKTFGGPVQPATLRVDYVRVWQH